MRRHWQSRPADPASQASRAALHATKIRAKAGRGPIVFLVRQRIVRKRERPASPIIRQAQIVPQPDSPRRQLRSTAAGGGGLTMITATITYQSTLLFGAGLATGFIVALAGVIALFAIQFYFHPFDRT